MQVDVVTPNLTEYSIRELELLMGILVSMVRPTAGQV
jgi:hypothetical protein